MVRQQQQQNWKELINTKYAIKVHTHEKNTLLRYKYIGNVAVNDTYGWSKYLSVPYFINN